MPTGGRTEQAYKHRARDVGERRTCGIDDRPVASMSRDVEARGSSGLAASRAPSDLISKAQRGNKARARMRCESAPSRHRRAAAKRRDPVIHRGKTMDCRVKPGNDNG